MAWLGSWLHALDSGGCTSLTHFVVLAKPTTFQGEGAVQLKEEKLVGVSDEEITIYPRRGWLILGVATCTCGGLMTIAAFVSDEPFPWWLIAFAIFCVVYAYLNLRRLSDSRPLLVINRQGVAVHYLRQQFVKWSEISGYAVLNQGIGGIQLVIRRKALFKIRVSQSICPIPLERVEEMMRQMSSR